MPPCLQQEAQSAEGRLDEGVPQDPGEGDGGGLVVRIREETEPPRQVRPRPHGEDDTGHADGPEDQGTEGADVPRQPNEGLQAREEDAGEEGDREGHRNIGPRSRESGGGGAERRRRGEGTDLVEEEGLWAEAGCREEGGGGRRGNDGRELRWRMRGAGRDQYWLPLAQSARGCESGLCMRIGLCLDLLAGTISFWPYVVLA
mmetsp:Transcript_43382/g.131976  ORF Transcript_43382/g.131976 Transcript_43382/m.131976 type:complete len:202 (+) Transcript_43382:260-865(+)